MVSHFVTAVLVTPAQIEDERKADPQTHEDTNFGYLNKVIERLLEPYDENTEVPEYDHKCYCIGRIAHNEAREMAEAYKPMDDLRHEFKAANAEREKAYEAENDGAHWAFSDESERLWSAHIAEYVRIQDEALAAHPLKDSPIEDCDECHGSGTYKSTYNPRSKWDWYTMGGRWSQVLVIPRTEAGKRASDEPSPTLISAAYSLMRERKDLVGIECFPASEFNVLPVYATQPYVAELLFSVLTPDGEWHEEGDMGWWGMVSDRKDKDKWSGEVRSILAEYPAAYLAIMDLHI